MIDVVNIVDVDYKFITMDVGSMDRFSDGSIFSSSVLAKNLNKTNFTISATSITDFEQLLPYTVVGDEAFLLSDNIMRPYQKKVLQEIMKVKFLITDFCEHGNLLNALLVY